MKDYRFQLFFGFFSMTIAADQVTKNLSPDIVLNTGVSFGLFPSNLLTIVLIVTLIAIALKFGKALYAISPSVTGVFFGGSLSNILDRILFGGVRDFLPVPLLAVQNNLADWAIILALLWLFFRMRQSSDTNTV